MREVTHIFSAMNTDITVIVVAPRQDSEAASAIASVEALFHDVEHTLSRFRPDSELSALNQCAGKPHKASALLFDVVHAALVASRETEGLFDPTVLAALNAAGYDQSFESVAQRDQAPRSLYSHPRFSWRDAQVDTHTKTIRLARGCSLDLGGIAKGWGVDRAAQILSPFENYAIDAGGDLYAGGVQGNGEPWTIGVQDPLSPDQDLVTLRMTDRAAATSSTVRRSWKQGGRDQHHLIDPRSGAPSESGVIAATVLARTVAQAEVMAKVALLLGPEEGLQLLESTPDVDGMLVLRNAEMRPSSGIKEMYDAA